MTLFGGGLVKDEAEFCYLYRLSLGTLVGMCSEHDDYCWLAPRVPLLCEKLWLQSVSSKRRHNSQQPRLKSPLRLQM